MVRFNKKQLHKSVDWSKIDKKEYLTALEESPLDDKKIKALLKETLADSIENYQLFMRGIDSSYYYEDIEEQYKIYENR